MRRILVTGRGGQLATGLEAALPAQGFEALLVGQPEFEFDKPETVIAALSRAETRCGGELRGLDGSGCGGR
jgi:dTDP-4-dehydrorhamnose reductase